MWVLTNPGRNGSSFKATNQCCARDFFLRVVVTCRVAYEACWSYVQQMLSELALIRDTNAYSFRVIPLEQWVPLSPLLGSGNPSASLVAPHAESRMALTCKVAQATS